MTNASPGDDATPTEVRLQEVRQIILNLQKTKHYRELAQMAGIKVVRSICGWGWRSLDDECTSDDLPYENDAWEAACFETGLMNDVDELGVILSDEVLSELGLK
jgi:hypothetical protein